jgi:hypothetical protein
MTLDRRTIIVGRGFLIRCHDQIAMDVVFSRRLAMYKRKA